MLEFLNSTESYIQQLFLASQRKLYCSMNYPMTQGSRINMKAFRYKLIFMITSNATSRAKYAIQTIQIAYLAKTTIFEINWASAKKLRKFSLFINEITTQLSTMNKTAIIQ